MQKEFTSDNLSRLKELYVQFSFSGEQLEGKFGANSFNPFQLLCQTELTTLENLFTTANAAAEAIATKSRWRMTNDQLSKQSRYKLWAEFLDLLIGYKLNEEEKARTAKKLQKKLSELDVRIADLADKNKSVEDLMKEKEELLKAAV